MYSSETHSPELPPPDSHARRYTETLAEEVEQFNVAMPGLHGEMFRAGAGGRRTEVAVRSYGDFRVMMLDIGFPIMGTVDNGPDIVSLAMILEEPGGSRWHGTDLADGMAFLYPPGTLHQAADAAGLKIGIASIDSDSLAQTIEDLGRHPSPLIQGLLRPDEARHVMRTFRRAGFSDDQSALTAAMASVLSSQETTVRPASARRLSSETITRRAIDYVHDTGQWSPSSLTLCRASGVSERRLQLAFADVYGMPPSRFFRLRALSMARSELVRAHGSMQASVTKIAVDLGFEHLSRFASEYRRHFGEAPSATLARARYRSRP